MTRLVAAILLCLLGACISSAHPDAPPSIELGTGTERFEPITEDESLQMHAGMQGGYHVWLSFRVRGLQPNGIRMQLDVVPNAPARAAHTDVMLDLVAPAPDAGADGEGWFEYLGWTAQVLDPECAIPGPVMLSLIIRDARARSVSATIEVQAQPPDGGFPHACQR